MAAAFPDVLSARCAGCHGADLIQGQRLSRAGWERELDKMVRWGAVVPDSERSTVLDALEVVSGAPPRIGAPQLANGVPGAEVFKRQCLTCHAVDIVEQQRLSPSAWRREVDKMVGWGARLDENERESLIAFLSDRFGLR